MAQRVLITGGAGFIGSHLASSYLRDGDEVTVVDDLSSGERRRVHPLTDFRKMSITEEIRLGSVVAEVEPSAIFHLAAQSSVTASVADPQLDCDVNVRGTLNVLETASEASIPVIFTSTGGALYGDEAPMPTPESFHPAPLAPYGASKLAGEAYVKTWAASTGADHAICRLGNVYGPGQTPHGEAAVVAIFADRLHQGQAPTLFGHGRATRDYVHVSDVVEALRAAVGVRGTFNIGTGIETDVQRVWDLVSRDFPDAPTPTMEPLRAGELQCSCLDPSLARMRLGWCASTPLEGGLLETRDALLAELSDTELRKAGAA